jgi:1,4-alpha-glucan branching enzyme
MVSKDSAAGYARDRAGTHSANVAQLAGLLSAGRRNAAARRVAHWAPHPFGHVDARGLHPYRG